MMFNQVVIQQEAMDIIKEFGINYEKYEDGLYTIDSIESTSAILYKAVHAGAKLFNCYSVEDVVFKDKKVSGVVVNWTPVLREACRRGLIDSRGVALGGVTPLAVKQLHAVGFGGAALLGDVWHRPADTIMAHVNDILQAAKNL